MTGLHYRILLVEDDPEDRLLVEDLLEEVSPWRAEVVWAQSYEEALAAAAEGGFDVALVDYRLGARRGVELLGEAVFASAKLPVIVLTGETDRSVDQEALSAGAVDFLPKAGLQAQELERSVRYAVEGGRRHRREARFRALIENSRDLLMVLDGEGTIEYVSPSLSRTLGFEPAERVGAPALEDVHPEDRPALRATFESLLADRSGQPRRMQHRAAHRDGSWRTFEIVAQNFLHDPFIRGIVVHAWDVTELHEAQQALLETTARLRQTWASLEEALFTVTQPGAVIVDCNPAAETMFGRPRGELLGRSMGTLHPDEAAWETFRARAQSHLRSEGRFHTECLMRRADGSTFPAEQTLTLLEGDRGPDGGVVALVRDVSDRVERQRRTAFQARLLDAVGQAVVATDAGGRISYWNRAAEELFGWRRDEVLGRPVVDVTTSSSSREDAEAILAELRSGRTWTGEFELARRDGSTFTALVTDAPILDEDGRLAGIIGVSSDLSERRHLQEQLRQSQKLEAIGRLAGGVAHDFNNLVTAITGHATMLLEDLEPDSPNRDDVREILKAGSRAGSLTRQLLAFSRKQVMEERHLDLREVVEDLQPMLRRLVPERVELRVERLHPEPLVIRGDASQLNQVVLNLVINAVDAIEGPGDIVLTLSAVDLTAERAQEMPWAVEPGPYARLAVRDTGSGMPPEILDHVFEPFFTTKPEGRGTGLGLSTVYGIVKQSRGHIEIDSRVGRGSEFCILLPLRGGSPEARESATPPAVRQGAGGTVLLVEDDASVRRLALRVLERGGYLVLSAADGREALRLAREHEGAIDIVVSDVIMPEIGGVELEARLRELYPRLKVVLTSGYSEAELRGEVRETGDAFLPKPYSPEDLLGLVGETLDAVTR